MGLLLRATTTSAPMNHSLIVALLYRVRKAIGCHLNALHLNIVSQIVQATGLSQALILMWTEINNEINKIWQVLPKIRPDSLRTLAQLNFSGFQAFRPGQILGTANLIGACTVLLVRWCIMGVLGKSPIIFTTQCLFQHPHLWECIKCGLQNFTNV